MAFDFLGTTTRRSWDKLNSFISEQVRHFSGGTDPRGYLVPNKVSHLNAEISRATFMLNEIYQAVKAFSGKEQEGDYAYSYDLYTPPLNGILVPRSDDGRMGTVVEGIKALGVDQIKYKKERLEFKVKKVRDLIHQLEEEVLNCLNLGPKYREYADAVTSSFSDTKNHGNHMLNSEIPNYKEGDNLDGTQRRFIYRGTMYVAPKDLSGKVQFVRDVSSPSSLDLLAGKAEPNAE